MTTRKTWATRTRASDRRDNNDNPERNRVAEEVTTLSAASFQVSGFGEAHRKNRPRWARLPPPEDDLMSPENIRTNWEGAAARTTTLTYDADGRLASITDPLLRTTSFLYDANGRVTLQTLPDGTTIGTSYDANGNVNSITPPGRPEHTFGHTPVDLQESYDPPDVSGVPVDDTSYAYSLALAAAGIPAVMTSLLGRLPAPASLCTSSRSADGAATVPSQPGRLHEPQVSLVGVVSTPCSPRSWGWTDGDHATAGRCRVFPTLVGTHR